MTIDQWQTVLANGGPNACVMVSTCELAELIDAYVTAIDKIEQVEEWALRNAAGDGLRAVLWPRKAKLWPEP